MLQDTNIFKFFLSGLSLLVNINCDSQLKEQTMSDFTKNTQRLYTERTLRFGLLALRSGSFKIKLSKESSFELIMDFLRTTKLPIPDGADFIDLIGEMFQSFGVMSIYELPVVKSLIDWLYEDGLCDITIACLGKNGAVKYNIRTEGIKEILAHVFDGFGIKLGS